MSFSSCLTWFWPLGNLAAGETTAEVKLDVFLYTAAISQCARAGDVLGAETIISQMQGDQVEPNQHTHCAIIAVYSKANLLPKAVEYFYEANKDNTLPIEAYCSILSGCRAVLDNKCALRILKKARQQESLRPVKSACYTLARQSCALAGDEIGAARVDKWQKMDGVVTHIPTSTVDDPSTGERLPFEPGYDEVAATSVKSMMACLKRAGYTPQLWQYDPEISNDEREDRLKYHTEKKALAWALQHFPQGSSITVRKTIRCCVDCHNAFKIASSAYQRTLRILDQVRMHEFSAGKCSCGDWWWSCWWSGERSSGIANFGPRKLKAKPLNCWKKTMLQLAIQGNEWKLEEAAVLCALRGDRTKASLKQT